MRPDPGDGSLGSDDHRSGHGPAGRRRRLDPEGGFRNFLDLEGQVIAPDGSRLVVPLEQVAPGRYQGEFPAANQGVYTAFISGSDGAELVSTTTGAVLAYPDEYRVLRPDSGLLYALAEQTGGIILTEGSADELRALLRHPSPAYASRPLAPSLLAGALLLFFVDVLVRYFPSHIFDSRQRERELTGDAAGERLPDEEALRARILAATTPVAQPGASGTRPDARRGAMSPRKLANTSRAGEKKPSRSREKATPCKAKRAGSAGLPARFFKARAGGFATSNWLTRRRKTGRSRHGQSRGCRRREPYCRDFATQSRREWFQGPP